MSTHHSPRHANGPIAPGFQQHRQGPNSRFNHDGLHNSSKMAPLDTFDPENMDFSLMHDLSVTPSGGDVDLELMFCSTDDLEMDQDMFSPNGEFQANWNMLQHQNMPGIDPSHMWHSSNAKPNGLDMSVPVDSRSVAQPMQSNIVSRRDGVREQFGQITPPEEEKRDSVSPTKDAADSKRKFQEDNIAKENRTQRARNAANKRHSKSKAAKQDSSQDPESDAGEGESVIKSSNMQREKNRLAAAKCRAKKKATSEEMQESHREGSKENSYLHREMRELRDQKAFLRNSLLQHEPGVCQCHAIHRFNFAQAQQLAMGVGAMIGQQQMAPLSPSQDSIASARTPDSDVSFGSRNGATIPTGVSRRPSVPSSLQSFSTGLNLNTNHPMSRPEAYPMPIPASDPSMQAQFADFLHNSPGGGRGGFS